MVNCIFNRLVEIEEVGNCKECRRGQRDGYEREETKVGRLEADLKGGREGNTLKAYIKCSGNWIVGYPGII